LHYIAAYESFSTVKSFYDFFKTRMRNKVTSGNYWC